MALLLILYYYTKRKLIKIEILTVTHYFGSYIFIFMLRRRGPVVTLYSAQVVSYSEY